MQLGTEVLWWGGCLTCTVGIYLLMQGAVMVRAMAKGLGSLEWELG